MPIVQRLIGLTALRVAPQDLPYAPVLLVPVVMASVAANYIALTLGPNLASTASPWLLLAVIIGYTAAFFNGVLQWRGLIERRVKTLLAVFGTDTVIVTVQGLALAIGDWQQPGPLAAFMSLSLLMWQLAVFVHILRHALSCRIGEATAWVAGYWLGTEVLIAAVSGGS
jgi:hypothetical protein